MNSKSITSVYVFLIIVLAFYAAGLMMPASWNWSVFAMPGLIVVQLAILGLVLILLFVPLLSSFVYEKLTDLFRTLSFSLGRLPLIVRALLWIAVPATLLYILRFNTHIYGDSQNLIGSIVSGKISSPFYNRIGMFMQLLARPFSLVQSTREAATNYVAALSILAGVAYMFFSWKTVKLMITARGAAIITYLAVITSGMIVIFAGYIEAYSIIIAWLSIYIYYSVKYLHGKGRSPVLVLLFVIGVLWHFWFIAFLPSLVYVLNQRMKFMERNLLFATGFIFCISIYFIGQVVRRGDFPLTISFLPSEQTNYILFSPAHLVDMANQVVMTGPILAALGLLLLIFGRSEKLQTSHKFLIWAGIPALTIAFMIDPHLGAARDWDLLSIFAAPLIILGAVLLQVEKKPNFGYLLLAILLFNLLHTGSILAANKNQDYAVDRIIRLTYDDPHYQTAYHDGIRNRPFAVILSNVYNRDDESIRFMDRRRNPEITDILSVADFHFNLKDYVNAVPYYKTLYDQGLLNVRQKFCYGKSQLMSRHPNVALEILKPVTNDSAFFDLYFNIGVSYLLTWRPDTGVIYLDSGLTVSDDPVEDVNTCLKIVRSTGSPFLMAHYQTKLFLLFPDSQQVRDELVDLYRKAGMPDSAEHYMNYGTIGGRK